ncbi:MAG: bifunctional phosphoribosylaminoimidazolecarboxamide formyltransferase/IMP cyclohydrolase PurH, partial [Bacteroidota bacterium]
MSSKKIKSALISVFSKDGLEPIIKELAEQQVQLYSTGGTKKFIEQLGFEVEAVENVTSYPSILDGRVKTLHPKVFGGLLARREEGHLAELAEYDIPEIDLVIVDLYPFEETLAQTKEEATIIEKIDIGGISLIRAAAKNYRDVVVVPSKEEYPMILELLQSKGGQTDLTERKELARRAFKVSSNYDVAIYQYFNEGSQDLAFKQSIHRATVLRYGENPHQQGVFYGDFEAMFDKLNGKPISYNNLVDIDAAVNLMAEFESAAPTFAVLKHTNACGVATRPTVLEAWKAALAGDSVSAFGG